MCEGTRQQWEKINKEFLTVCKRGLRAQGTMATRLFYFDKAQGIGLPNFADTVEQEKYMMLQRGLARPCTRQAMFGMLNRVTSDMDIIRDSTQGAKLQPGRKDLWLTSLLTHAKRNEVELQITGSSTAGHITEPLAEFLTTDLLDLLKDTNISTVGVLTYW